jgi:tetratricopeptide (TPR) repeat protein
LEPNVASLDSAWERRAGLHAPIVAFVKSKPRLADDYDVLWRVGRLAYYAGFFALSPDARKDEKLDVFRVGMEASDKARKLQPGRVEAHYWYAVSVGGFGINKGVMASLGSADDMRQALDEAVRLDQRYHFAGPLRVRGRLYFKLPGGLISFGDNKKALADLRRAVDLGSESKLNYAYLAEVVHKTEDSASALKLLEAAKKLPDVAGEAEEASYRRDIGELERRFK